MVSEAMLPRTVVREVEQRLTAAGCPDADFDARELFRLVTGRDVRLSDRPLTAEQAAALEVLCTRRAAREPLQYLCGSWSFLDFELAVGPAGRRRDPCGHRIAPGAGPLRRDRLSGVGGQALLSRRAGDLRGKKPCGLCLSGKERPLRSDRAGQTDRECAGTLCP